MRWDSCADVQSDLKYIIKIFCEKDERSGRETGKDCFFVFDGEIFRG